MQTSVTLSYNVQNAFERGDNAETRMSRWTKCKAAHISLRRQALLHPAPNEQDAGRAVVYSGNRNTNLRGPVRNLVTAQMYKK
jgi:hypothetical protein